MANPPSGLPPRPKKSLGQNYLQVQWPGEKVVASLREHGVRSVLEIDPGPGILTQALIQGGFAVTAVEKDERFIPELEAKYFGQKLTIVHQDILQFDLAGWIAQLEGPIAVVGNIPYNISTPIMMWLLPHQSDLSVSVFLVQKEFAERICASSGNKNFGSLSVFVQLRARVHWLAEVGRGCFRPAPKVDSALFAMTPRVDCLPETQLAAIERVCRCTFQNRRKMLRRSLQGLTNAAGLERLQEKIDVTRRPETLDEGEFILIAKTLLPEAF